MRKTKKGDYLETIFPPCTCERADYHAPDHWGIGAQLGFCIKRGYADTNTDTDTDTDIFTNSYPYRCANWYTDTHTDAYA